MFVSPDRLASVHATPSLLDVRRIVRGAKAELASYPFPIANQLRLPSLARAPRRGPGVVNVPYIGTLQESPTMPGIDVMLLDAIALHVVPLSDDRYMAAPAVKTHVSADCATSAT
jgi:hypothetical protein